MRKPDSDWTRNAPTVGRASQRDVHMNYDPVVPNPARRVRKGDIVKTAVATSVVGITLGAAATLATNGSGEPPFGPLPTAVATEKPVLVSQEFGKPYKYFTGEITVKMDRGLNVRTEPKLSEMAGYSNKKDWNQVVSINGENLQGAEAFNIKNAIIVRGGAVDPNITGGDWILLKKVVVKDGSKEVTVDLFVSLGNTYAFVRESPVGHREDIYQQDGQMLAPNGGFDQVKAFRPDR